MFNLNSIGFQYQLNSLLIVSNEKFKSFHVQFEFNWISISIQLIADPIRLKPSLSFFSLPFVSIRNKVRRSALFHRPQKYFFLRSWDLVQEDAAAPAKPLLLHRALLLGRVDLHDHRLPWRLPHHVSSRQVREKYRVFVLCCHLLSTMFVKRQYFPQRKANEKMILEGDGPSRQLKCKLE